VTKSSLQARPSSSAAMATFAEAPKGNEKAGEKIFKTKCAQCHVVEKGAGHKQGQLCSSLVVERSVSVSRFAFRRFIFLFYFYFWRG
jgi:cytochrome c2